MGAYAACAFSSLAPGAVVIAYSPQSMLAPGMADWDLRYPDGRAADWTGPFADAADEVGTASSVWLVHDPKIELDARHAARFTASKVRHLRARHSQHGPIRALREAGVLGDFTREIVAGTMTHSRFYALSRSRPQVTG